ncbi:uncharacterized protein LOC127744792 isoform X2 [Arachis duranensis]|uniref:Uncharacterized protein LOC127744792 isoform X2 n=1 Tax=Arachis duranensis TaxID=130453 RepID=A0A9C6TFQ3_ARADU|nr:uncharacterized protein LOC127744792 isoform X2 [Arachis duranensis]
MQFTSRWRIWQEKSFLPFSYYFKFKTVLCLVNTTRRRVAAKLSMKGHEEIHNCYGQGTAFFMGSTNKMCIRPLIWQLQLGEHVKRNATMLNTSFCIYQAGSDNFPLC